MNGNSFKKSDNRLKRLGKGKARSLGFFEKISMKYNGWVDGRKGLLRCNKDGSWQSSFLKHEVDTYEEFCAEQMGILKVEQEDEFKKMNVLFDKVAPLRTKLSEAEKRLQQADAEEIDLSERKAGEENLTEMQVAARRSRERSEQLEPFRNKVRNYETELSETVDEIFERVSQVRESFDSAIKITNRLLQHCQRRVDVYWRSAMRQIPELPAVPRLEFSNVSIQAYEEHFNKVAARADQLRNELTTE